MAYYDKGHASLTSFGLRFLACYTRIGKVKSRVYELTHIIELS